MKQICWSNFLVIGAAKSGTNSVFNYLKGHPQVFMPGVKEPHFFPSINRGYGEMTNYENLFREGWEAKMRGGASTGYLFDPLSPKRIRKQLGEEVKLVCILRNPVEAIYSLWGQSA